MSFDRSSGYQPRFCPGGVCEEDRYADVDRELISRAKSGALDSVTTRYPVQLKSGDWIVLPMRPLNDELAIAYFKTDEMPFAFIDPLARLLAEEVRHFTPDVVAGIATLGLSLADAVARSLGHASYLPFGNSKKPWFEEDLSEPLEAVTSQGIGKRLWVEPFIVEERVRGKRIVVIDDGMCTGGSMLAAMKLVQKCGGNLVGIAGFFTETHDWKKTLTDGGFPQFVEGYRSLCHIPIFVPGPQTGTWVVQDGT